MRRPLGYHKVLREQSLQLLAKLIDLRLAQKDEATNCPSGSDAQCRMTVELIADYVEFGSHLPLQFACFFRLALWESTRPARMASCICTK